MGEQIYFVDGMLFYEVYKRCSIIKQRSGNCIECGNTSLEL